MKKNKSNLPEDTREKLKKLGYLFLNFVLFYALYRIIIEFSERLRMPVIYYIGAGIYAGVAVVTFIWFFILNGFTFDKEERTIDELPEKWSMDKKMEFLGKQSENKAKARRLMYILLPIVIVLLVDYIGLMFIK